MRAHYLVGAYWTTFFGFLQMLKPRFDTVFLRKKQRWRGDAPAGRTRSQRGFKSSTRGILPSSAVESAGLNQVLRLISRLEWRQLQYFTCSSVKRCVIRPLLPKAFGTKELQPAFIALCPRGGIGRRARFRF